MEKRMQELHRIELINTTSVAMMKRTKELRYMGSRLSKYNNQ